MGLFEDSAGYKIRNKEYLRRPSLRKVCDTGGGALLFSSQQLLSMMIMDNNNGDVETVRIHI